jgi:isochorismate synthase
METDLSRTTLDERLGGFLRQARAKCRQERRPVLASLTEPIGPADLLSMFHTRAEDHQERFLWLQPDSGFSITGVGAAYEIETNGPNRFSDTAAAWDALCSAPLIEPDNAPCGPVLMGGFSFDQGQPASKMWRDYPDGRMVLPRLCITSIRGQSWLTVNAVLGPDTSTERETAEVFRLRSLLQAAAASNGARPNCGKPIVSELRSCAGWRDEVAAATRAMRRGEFAKVVLARGIKLEAAQPFEPVLALRRLSDGYPTCVIFAIARGNRCFLGATPERLLQVRHGEVRTTCLAGSYPRGADEAADRKLGEALLADPKERNEHGLVLGTQIETLTASCTYLNVPAAPTVLKLPNVQHLCTPLSGRLAPGRGILQVVEQLHPTPSVGGQPRDLALRFIREREALDRGWYTGAVGWMDHRGEGEFAVAIRAALLNGAEATLFAGCGIVADSDPEREYAESCIKLTPMLTALGAD